jgi:histidyl-tRNA synthetase
MMSGDKENRGGAERGLQAVRGTRDVLPGESEAWQRLEETVHEVMFDYGFREIRTPIFEETQLFARGIGEHTDIVGKEMYTFPDQGGRSLTLRPEGTAGVVRAYLEHRLDAQGVVDKLYYLGPMFRQEAPQKGRARQFHQFGAEIVGTDAPEADAEVILNLLGILEALGLDSWELRLGSLGCRRCRPAYREQLLAFLKGVASALCPECRARLDTNPWRVLDCKKEGCRTVTAGAPSQLDFLDPECRSHFQTVRTLLEDRGISFQIDPRLVRGLDYYERTTFEVLSPALGAQDALGGGGRYDGLAEMLGSSQRIPGVGYAAGIERILIALEAAGRDLRMEAATEVVFVPVGEAARRTLFGLCDQVRRSGVACHIDLAGRSVKAQMREANRLKARLAVIAGEQELAAGILTLKDLADSSERKLPLEGAAAALLEHIIALDELDEEEEEA